MPIKNIHSFVLLFMLTGCSVVGPAYSPPEIEVGKNWTAQYQQTVQEQSSTLASWWNTLEDPQLIDLIDQALLHNLDLQEVQSRVRQARLERIVTRASLFPTLDGSGSARKSYTRDSGGEGRETDAYSAGFDASWEIDLFGGVRKSVEASQADYEASVESLRDTRVSLIAEVALDYIQVRTYQERLRVARENILSQQQTLDLLTALSKAGRGDELAIAQARYNLESSKANIPDMQTGFQEYINSLAILTGKPAGTLQQQFLEQRPIPTASMELAIGVPADLLRRRPDIRQAERELAAQTARVGEAKAELYPKLSLTGSIGLEAISADKLINAPTRLWSLGPTFSWPIFRAGALRNQVKIEDEQMQQQILQYKAAVLNATEEVENAIIAYANEQQKLQRLQEGSKAARLAEQLAEHQYATGMTGFSDVLDAQRSLLSFEDQIAQSSGTVLSNLIRLYKALGGGWQSMSETDAPHTTVTKTNPTR
ncbi:efflux transporter outer membrane subunit [Desulfogranum japonicum]|uniref:efflux transporter outer membrane subunit n=1 Tax=Desulfogranum japonicum TaxID=231447 RepID=UPI00040806FA|nr:efflux transporter outer membrane subunit [Desulfogranum japonicum]